MPPSRLRRPPGRARSTVPVLLSEGLLVRPGSGGAQNAHTRRRQQHTCRSPRIMTPNAAPSPAHGARGTGVLVTPQPDSSRRRGPWRGGQPLRWMSTETRPRCWLLPSDRKWPRLPSLLVRGRPRSLVETSQHLDVVGHAPLWPHVAMRGLPGKRSAHGAPLRQLSVAPHRFDTYESGERPSRCRSRDASNVSVPSKPSP